MVPGIVAFIHESVLNDVLVISIPVAFTFLAAASSQPSEIIHSLSWVLTSLACFDILGIGVGRLIIALDFGSEAGSCGLLNPLFWAKRESCMNINRKIEIRARNFNSDIHF